MQVKFGRDEPGFMSSACVGAGQNYFPDETIQFFLPDDSNLQGMASKDVPQHTDSRVRDHLPGLDLGLGLDLSLDVLDTMMTDWD